MHNFAVMKLKRHIGILLSALILFSNIGLALSVHYCHGSVSAVALSYKTDHCSAAKVKATKSCCAKAKAAAQKKCCKNHVVKLEDTTAKTLVKSLQLDLGAFYIAAPYNNNLQFLNSPAAKQKKENPSFYADSNAPPLYKLYCRYVLYA